MIRRGCREHGVPRTLSFIKRDPRLPSFSWRHFWISIPRRLSEKHIHIKTLYDASCKDTVFARAFREVVPICLDGEFWAQFETSLAVDDDCALRAAIYKEVVRPLKAQLKSSYGDDLQKSIKQHGSFDKFAQENISIDISSLNNFTMGIRPKTNPSPVSTNEPSPEAGSNSGNMMSTDSKRSDA